MVKKTSITSKVDYSNSVQFVKWYDSWLKEQIVEENILKEQSDILLVDSYAHKVISGQIVASQKVILAAKRHFSDLEKQGTDEFPWVFIEDKGHRPIRFIEKFCKPSKGDFKRLVFQPWQHFIIGSLYGWVHRDTGVRRFREAITFVGRKNGKTTMISSVATFAVSKDDEPGARVYVLANSKQQAGELFDESRAMVQSSPQLRKHFRENQKGIFHDKTKSKIEPRASDSKRLDGLNTHLGIFDEIHEFKDYKLINVIKKSRGSRRQPLILYITTAGYQLDGPLVNYYEQSDDTLKGIIPDDRTFYFMAELDSDKEFDHPELWIKANPNMGVSLDLPTLYEDWIKDKRTPQERADFITKQFNLFVDSEEQSFLDYEIIQKNKKIIELDTLIGQSCIGGFDLSETEDFTSASLEFPLLETGEIFVLSHSWVTDKKAKKENEKIPYKVWEAAGHLTICKGEYVDYDQVYKWFTDMSELYSIENITYDRANAFKLVKELEAYGFALTMVRQGHLTLSPALKDLKEMYLDGKVISNANPLLIWYTNNVKLVKDRNENWMPTKQNKYRKIDGFAALLNSHTEVMERLAVPPGDGDIEFVSINDLLRG